MGIEPPPGAKEASVSPAVIPSELAKGNPMSDGLESAKERRNLLERLGAKIPGFKGFQDRELRRDVDKLQREHLAEEVGAIKRAVRDKAGAFTDAGRLDELRDLDRLERRLDGLSQAVRFADYGMSGLFDAVKIGEEELDRLYRFDLSLLEDLGALKGAVAAIPSPGDADAGAAASRALEMAGTLAEKWRQREMVISDVVEHD